ncbi:protein MKT1 [Leishmania donovani]|uniref:Protein mkt1, putative n=1 Tax=Leishmania donovani TaxID=5661 RepID=A0A3Q8IF24_LEIDO|nr:hypothetical protein, conserved [Leishmania donovani]AYU81148.1 protein mkt1, putative [Leishmania donovani]CAJ1991141.1 protein MKT1 [Leishmania donovani]CBZ36369.1 hypothetical protein, conserved [Leishmania donovani]VDZ46988.1 protein_mkt1_putative/GeneDB:LmjF.30.3430 [Leishmania donovani]
MYPHSKQSMASTIHSFVTENKIEEKGLKLSELRRLPNSNQVSIVFDGNRVLDDVVQDVHVTGPLTIFTASTPWSAYTVISEYTEMVRKLGEYFRACDADFKPMFVFNGCGFHPMEDQDTTSPAPPMEVASYSAYNKNKTVRSVPAEAQKKFASRFAIEEDVEGLIVRKLCEVAEETMRAPYLAWSQISAFFAPSNTMTSETFGSLELLAFPGIDRVITNIDVDAGTFDCVSKASMMAALRRRYDAEFSEDDFSAIALYETKNRLFRVKNRRETFDDLCRLPRDPTRVDAFMKQHRVSEDQKLLLRRNLGALDAPVFTVDAQLVPLSTLHNRPRRCEIRPIFGSPMPIVFFYLFMSGPLLPLPFAIHSQEVLADDWPLIDTSAYRRAAESILPLRVQVVFQLFPIAPKTSDFYWIRQYVVFKKQQQAPESQSRVCKLSNPPTIDLAYWSFMEEELLQSTRDADNVYFTDIVSFCGCAVAEPVIYKSVQATLAAVYLRSLDFLGYFTHATDGAESSGPSVYCKALERFDCPTLSEYGVLLIELMRTGTLNDDPLVVVLNRVDDTIPMGVRFASRLVSIIPANVCGPWSGPFDPEMAAFGVISRLFSRTLRVLHEVVAMLLFANRATTVPWDQFSNVVQRLPFNFPAEFSAGFLMTYVLCNPQCTMEELCATFPEMYALDTDLQTLFWFFTMGFEAIRVINYEEPLSYDMVQVVNAARQLVGQACERLCPDVFVAHFPTADILFVAQNQGMDMGPMDPQMDVPMPMNNMHGQMPSNMNMNMNMNMHTGMNSNMMQYQPPRMY